MPDQPESLRYLDLILSSKRGPSALSERAQELTAIVKAHPANKMALRALGRLFQVFKKMGKKDALAQTAAAATKAGCPPHIVSHFRGTALSPQKR